MKEWLNGLRHSAPFLALALAAMLSSGAATTVFASDDDNPKFSVADTTETAREGVNIPDDEDEDEMVEETIA